MVRALVVFGIAFAAACHGPSAPVADASVGPDASAGACVTDDDCGAHEVCDDTAAPHACVCAAGYAGGPCAWVGVIANPGFTDQSAWTLQGDTKIDETFAIGSKQADPGALYFFPRSPEDPNFECVGVPYKRASQMITMPRRSRAEPLVVEAHHYDDSPLLRSPIFGIDGIWHTVSGSIQPPPEWAVARSCLGAGEYASESTTGRGAPLPFAIMVDDPRVCFHDSQLFIDRVEIVPANAGECPDFGQVVDGDAEGTDGWSFTAGPAPTTAGLVDGAGVNGSRAVAFHVDKRCDVAEATDPISIPVAGASPALSFYARASVGATVAIWFEDVASGVPPYVTPPVAYLAGTGAGGTHAVCIPGYLRGATTKLHVRLSAPDVANACSDIVALDAAIDDVAIVDDPSCGTDPSIADGGFESTNVPLHMSGNAAVVHDASLAFSGQGVLQLGIDSACAGGSWNTLVVAPAPAAGAGPAVAYEYEAPSGTQADLAPGSIADGQWHRAVTCLDPRLVDTPQWIGIGFWVPAPAPTTCTPVQAYFDDVTVTTDPSCPTM